MFGFDIAVSVKDIIVGSKAKPIIANIRAPITAPIDVPFIDFILKRVFINKHSQLLLWFSISQTLLSVMKT